MSAIGDEVYKVAIVWLAADWIGADAGYLFALQAGCLFIFSLLGGWLADDIDERRTLITVDLLRGFVVLIPPIAAAFGKLDISVIVVVTILLYSLSAFFEPALRAILPGLVHEEPQLLHATNALVETTPRMGRALGPGIVAVIGRIVPVVCFFVVDSLSYFGSAYAIYRMKVMPFEKTKTNRESLPKVLTKGWQLVRRDPMVRTIFMLSPFIAASWWVVLPMGLGLLVHERSPQGIDTFGRVVMIYGIANLVSNIVVGSLKMKNYPRWIFASWVLVGVGFTWVSFAHTWLEIALTSAIGAIAGPPIDVAFLGLVQNRFTRAEALRVYRLNNVFAHGVILVFFLLSPWLTRLWNPAGLLRACGLVMLACAVLGWLGYWRIQSRPAVTTS